MVNVSFVGRLGADAEVKSSKSGNQYVTMRVAVNQYNGKENETVWMNVTAFTDRDIKMAQYWKKGSQVEVHGGETCSIYTKSNGESAISRDVRAYNIDFVNGGGSASTSSDTSEVASTPQVKPTVAPSAIECGTFTKPVAASVCTEATDDLPF